jgi:predicted nucleic acid-binding protein
MLTDTGPLVAIVLPKQRSHQRCLRVLAGVRGALETTWAAFTEAMYLVGRDGGWMAQQRLWELLATDRLRLVDLAEVNRARELMLRYRDRPMSLADATLVTAAEERRSRRIFSLDEDFYVYRLADGRSLEVIPGPR